MRRKSIAKNSIYNVLYRGFTALFQLLTTTYMSRVLLPEGVGKVAYANTVVTYFITIAALGIPTYGVKVIASKRENKADKSKSFAELFLINLISTVFCACLYYIFVNTSSLFADKVSLMNTMGILLVLNVFNIDWFYQGIEEYRYICVRSILVKTVAFVLMLVFVKTKDDFLIYVLLFCLANAGNYVLNLFYSRKHIQITNVQSLDFRVHIKPVFILVASAVATEIYTMLDTVMLELIRGDAAVGFYSNSVKIVRMIHTSIIALVAAFFPKISAFFHEGDQEKINDLLSQGTAILLLISIPSVIGVIGVADYIVPILLGEAFIPSTQILRVLAVLIFILSIAYFLGHIVLLASGNEGKILKATICGSVINAALNSILIPEYSGTGAAISSVIAEILVTALMIKSSKKYFKLNIDAQFIKSIGISNALMLAALIIARRICAHNIFGLIAIVILSVVIYLIGLMVTKNSVFLKYIAKLHVIRKN